MFLLVGVLAFSIIAGLGYQKWQNHQLEAQAASSSQVFTFVLPNSGGQYIRLTACKTLIRTGLGNYYKVTTTTTNRTNYRAAITQGTYRSGSTTPIMSNIYYTSKNSNNSNSYLSVGADINSHLFAFANSDPRSMGTVSLSAMRTCP